MSAGELISVDPIELKFPFELRKQISCSLQISNKTDEHVAFKVKTTNPKKYCVRPNNGVLLPRSTCVVVVTMQAQKEVPSDMQCKDKFLVQSSVVNPGTMAKDITAEVFSRGSSNKIDEMKLRVLYVSPLQPPSPVHEGSDEGTSPKASISENGNMTTSQPALQSSASVYQEKSVEPTSQATKLISVMTEEKNTAIQQNKKLLDELEFLKLEMSKQRGGSFSFMFVVIVALLGFLVGYLVKT